DTSLTRTGAIAGTPLYMSPEQAKGEAVDQRCDLFSLGSVLYALATGKPPFLASSTLVILKRVTDEQARPIREVRPDVPTWLADTSAGLREKAPARRPASAAELAGLLRQGLEHLRHPERTPPPQLGALPAARPPRRRKWLALAAVGVLLIGALAGGLIY